MNTSLWRRYFDRIYLIHFIPNKDRLPRITTELDRVGILNSGIFRWEHCYPISFEKEIYENHKDIFRSVSELSISLSHYNIIKRSFERGFDRILILEDDEVFLKDLRLLEFYLSKFPELADIVRMDYIFGSTDEELGTYKKLVKSDSGNYIDTKRIKRIWSAGNYSLNRTGMEHVILNQENALRSPEYYLYHRNNIITPKPLKVISRIPLSIQIPYKVSHTSKLGINRSIHLRRYNKMGINIKAYYG